jgi:predicted DCC family thiol-disulfide oxidoreductase YuxK
VARVVVGVAALLKGLERYLTLDRLGDAGILRIPYVPGQPSIADLPAGAVVIAWVALAAAFAAGAYTTVTGITLTILLTAALFSDQQLYSNHLYLLIWLVGLLTLARSGAALSIDARRGRGRSSVPAWPLALLRLQVIVLYFFAGLSKINLAYLSGSVVAVSLRREGPLAIPGDWRSFEVMAAAAMLSILAELGLAIGLALPRWRRAAFVLGLMLHLGIALWFDPTLPLVIFGVMSLGPYVLFLDDRPQRLAVVWDDSCTFCRGWVTWFRRLDWLGVLRIVPNSDQSELERLHVSAEDADRALQLVGSRRRSQGFRAVVGILETLPISFLWAPLLRVWPIRPVGDIAYRRVAERRSCGIMRTPV